MVSSSSAALTRAAHDDLSSVDEHTLRELLERRRRHGPLRVLSVFLCATAALTLLINTNERDPGVGLMLLYGVPIAVVVVSELVARFFWRRHARRLGLTDRAFDELRAKIATVPRSIPPASVDTLLAAVRGR